MSQLRPIHIVATVAAICGLAVLTPVAVGAATITVTRIADSDNAARQAHVTKAGYLDVATRAAASSKNLYATINNSTPNLLLAKSVAPTQVIITQLTVASAGGSNETGNLTLNAWVRTSPTSTTTCADVVAGTTTGYTKVPLRYIRLISDDNVVLTWPGPGMAVPAAGASGRPTCLVANSLVITMTSILGMTYYEYTP